MKNSLENYLYTHIPLSSSMGIKVDQASTQLVVLNAPLAPNINHKKTVFGGSLHAVATLACWSLLHLLLADVDKQIVITSSEIQYLAPVTMDFKTECRAPNVADWEHFIKALKKGKARIKLGAQIFQDGRLCVDYSGVFAAIQP